ncbi:hypothetical protein HDF09_002801 [Edaphobacter lichenicola]|uniref:Uncharacterized protein n=1 Tax=Tunturiibacter empetritectus TaxID=3069691 RepID=A0A7W8MTE1_9BACT|nr:hypothetical protein [Edaphobacter lichenicola]
MNSPSSVESFTKAAVVGTRLSGYDLLLRPGLNKRERLPREERDAFVVHGLLPPYLGTLTI